jgi:PPK2 family polyphosphate:nucleotide phosphotransferase
VRGQLSVTDDYDGAMKRHRVDPGEKFDLADYDPDDTSLVKGGKREGEKASEKLCDRLGELQDVLYAEHRWKLLIILQGMDTSGKDGTIRHVMHGVDPLGVRVVSFKKPSEEELDHDFLWRVHAKVPARGEVTIFNRSHYEDVLVVRVHDLVAEKVWRKRYGQINDFEEILAKNDTVILKFFLHISKDEQRKRLQERVDNPKKRWKFQMGDIEERKFWDDYMEAYEEAIENTSTEFAPWYVVPSNAKWYRNYVIGSILVKRLEALKMKVPDIDLKGVVIPA